jgi:hypothetical protein
MNPVWQCAEALRKTGCEHGVHGEADAGLEFRTHEFGTHKERAAEDDVETVPIFVQAVMRTAPCRTAKAQSEPEWFLSYWESEAYRQSETQMGCSGCVPEAMVIAAHFYTAGVFV